MPPPGPPPGAPPLGGSPIELPLGGAPIELLSDGALIELGAVAELALSDAELVPEHPAKTVTASIAAIIVASSFFFPIV